MSKACLNFLKSNLSTKYISGLKAFPDCSTAEIDHFSNFSLFIFNFWECSVGPIEIELTESSVSFSIIKRNLSLS